MNKDMVIIQIYLLGAFPSAKSFYILGHPSPSCAERKTPDKWRFSLNLYMFPTKGTPWSVFKASPVCALKNKYINSSRLPLFCSGKICPFLSKE